MTIRGMRSIITSSPASIRMMTHILGSLADPSSLLWEAWRQNCLHCAAACVLRRLMWSHAAALEVLCCAMHVRLYHFL